MGVVKLRFWEKQAPFWDEQARPSTGFDGGAWRHPCMSAATQFIRSSPGRLVRTMKSRNRS